MANLSQQDLDVRLQLSSCCSGTKGGELLSKIKVGSKDVNCKLQDLQVIQGMLKYLKCYKPLVETETLATGTIEINTIDIGDSAQFFINGIPITDVSLSGTSNETTAMIALTNAINTYQTTYTAEFDPLSGSKGIVRIVGTCDNNILSINVTSGTITTTLTGMYGGTCEVTENDNCLTEVQTQSMFNYLATKCKECFQPIGFSYTD